MKKIHIMGLVFLAATAAWMHGHWQQFQSERALAEARVALAALQNRIDSDQAALAEARLEQKRQNQARSRLAADAAGARRQLALADPASQWARPPAALPDWNPKSPYIWVRKDLLASLHPPALNWQGALSRDAADILGLSEEDRVKLNQQVQGALDNFRSLQNSNAVVTNTLPDGGAGDGPVVTITIPALVEEGEALQTQLTQILEQNLGRERAAVLTNAAADWLEGFALQEPDVFSVMQNPNGTYRVSSKSANDSYTYDGISARGAYNHIPQNFAPVFTGILPPPADGQ